MRKLRFDPFIKHFLIYRYIYLFFIFALIIDLIGVYAIEGNFIIEKPLILLIFLIFISISLFFINIQVGKIIAILILIIQSVLNVLFKMVYVMQGQTVFTLSQLNFLKEGTGAVTKYIVDYILILNYIFLISLYLFLIIFKRYKVRRKKARINLLKTSVYAFFIVALLSIMSSLILRVVRDTFFDYDEHPYSTPRRYQTYGITGNLISELSFHNKVPNEIDEEKVNSFLFSKIKTSRNFSPENNLIIVMVETLEWYAFLQDDTLYPNGLPLLSEEERVFLFPNLTKFYDESLKMTNFYSRETTINSENLAILGNHPYRTIPTYHHTFANYEYSLPNMFKKAYPQAVTSYYHNNNISFYGRGGVMNNFGFDQIYGAEKLIAEYQDKLSFSEVNLGSSISTGITDASMFEVAKAEMFPLDKHFLTFITTLTMHGSYENTRSGLASYYEKLDSLNKELFPDTKEGQYLRNYLASVLNFDHALGIMMDYLDSNNLLDNTTIVMFSDHQAYSNDLTYYVREKNFFNPVVFNVPFMIYDKNLGNNTISKFSTNIDIVPTIFDILGINYYENFYYGSSIFENKESVSYSYYYEGFLTDKILFKTLSKTLYIDESIELNYVVDLEERIRLMFERIKYIDQWYYYYAY